MELNEEQIKSIEDLAGMSWDPEKIAHYMDVDKDEFLREYHDPESLVRYHYDRGMLIAQADVDRGNLQRARDGNLTSLAQYKREVNAQKIENYKKKIEMDKLVNEYEQLQTLVEKGEVANLPQEVVTYFEQMDFIRSLYLKWNTRNYIVSMVILKWKNISRRKAEELYADTLNFFYLDNKVKVEAWKNIYADRLDQIAALAYEMTDIETARRTIADAAKMRGVGQEKSPEIPPEMYQRRPVIYMIDPKQLGISKVNRRELADWLDSLDITEMEKHRLRKDAGIEEAYFEIVEAEPNAESQDN